MKKLMTEWRNFINEQSAGLAHDSKYEDSLRLNNALIDYCKEFPTKCTPEKVKKMLDKAGVEPVLDGVKQLLGMPLGPKPLSPGPKPLSPEDLKVINMMLEIDPKEMWLSRTRPQTLLSLILDDYPRDVLKSYLSHIEGLFNDPSHRFDSEEQIKRYRNLVKELEYQFMNPEEKKAYRLARKTPLGKTVTDYGKTSVGMYKEK